LTHKTQQENKQNKKPQNNRENKNDEHYGSKQKINGVNPDDREG